MDAGVRTIEATGMIDDKRRLVLDTPLPDVGPARVRVLILLPEAETEDTSEQEWLRAAAANPAFNFLTDPEEDLYTLADGEPFYDQG